MPITQLFGPTALENKKYAVGNVAFKMIRLPGHAHFLMGDNKGREESSKREQPKHARVIRPFFMAEFPVTQRLWQEVVSQGRMQGLVNARTLLPLNPAFFPGARCPVEKTSWEDAHNFCTVLNILLGKKEGFFRLSSEAEWEYAARAHNRYSLYAGSSRVNEVAWLDKNNGMETMPVGMLAPNAFGLYDMSGNVSEWCEDDWHNDYKNHPHDGRAWVDDQELRVGSRVLRVGSRVLRGGSWNYRSSFCRLTYRSFGGYRNREYGFRLAAPAHTRPDGRI